MVSGNLLYGHDHVMNNYISTILKEKPIDKYLDAKQGLKNVQSLNEIVKKSFEK